MRCVKCDDVMVQWCVVCDGELSCDVGEVGKQVEEGNYIEWRDGELKREWLKAMENKVENMV